MLHANTAAIFSQMNKTLNLQYHGIFCIIWRHILKFSQNAFTENQCVQESGKLLRKRSQPDCWKQKFCVKCFKETLKENSALDVAIIHDISASLLFCPHLFNTLVRLFSILLFLCNAIFSFSCKHSDHLLLLVL